MQNLAMQEHDPIEVTIYHLKPIILLHLVSVSETDAKKVYIAGELLYVTYHKNPVSYMECETICILTNRPFKAAVDSWKGRNKGKGTPHYFVMERSIGGYY
jgi:hypothetical protein